MGQKAITLDEQIALLSKRGMVISDVDKAKEVLYDAGYYRLGFYWFPFEKSYPLKHNRTHEFIPNTQFNSVVKLYYFDFYLRCILFKALSRIEVAFRTKVTYIVSNEYTEIPSWFADSRVVTNNQVKYYQEGGYKAIKDKNRIIGLHHSNHPKDKYAPAWKAIEYMTLGEILHLFKSIKDNKLKERVASEFGIKTLVTLESYLEVIKNLRNVSAHSNVLYDFTPEKSIRKGPAMMKGIGDNQNLNGAIRVVLYMLGQISNKRSLELLNEIEDLIAKYGVDQNVYKILLNISGFKDLHRY
ncbi:MAG: Abi family protein [Muribaculaceae bacterium]|nr:Abi family protein [Muribaculaceae bacterium]